MPATAITNVNGTHEPILLVGMNDTWFTIKQNDTQIHVLQSVGINGILIVAPDIIASLT